MYFDGALIEEQGVSFAIVVVKPYVLSSSYSCDQARNQFRGAFPGVPIILMAQDGRGIPTYQGRPDIVQYLAHIHPSRIPWTRYSYS